MAPDPSARDLVRSLCGVLVEVAEPQTVLRTILKQAMALTDADGGVLVEVREKGRVDKSALYRFDRDGWREHASDFSRSIIGRVAASGATEVIADATTDSRFAESESVQELHLLSVLCAPLTVDRRVVAVVYLEKYKTRHFTKRHAGMLEALAVVAGPVLQAARAGRSLLAERNTLRARSEHIRRELDESREVLSRDWSFGRFVGRSEPIRALGREVRRAASTEFPVLITGETGTGKSLLARIVHSSSSRSRGPFVTVFCPALQREMVETTLFGHRRGAFTGASQDRLGSVQAAEHGTLFLDEVGELPVEVQPKLLRLLHEKTYERVGDHRERAADVRIIAATNKRLEQETAAGRFREDLYQRLAFVPLHIPPLRDRREDISPLLRHCLDRLDVGRWVEVPPEVEEYLRGLDYTWPGNVREIEQLAAQLILLGEGGRVDRSHAERVLAPKVALRHPAESSAPGRPTSAGTLPERTDRYAREILAKAIRDNPGLPRKALAQKLGISERTLYKKLREYDLG